MSDYDWDEAWFDPVLRLYLARHGSMTYVLEGAYGRPLSSGHHTLWRVGDVVWGSVGATEEIVRLAPSMYRPVR